MKLIYAQGFSKNEKLEWKPVVFQNIVQSFRLIYEAMNELGIKFENEENEVSKSSGNTSLMGPFDVDVCGWSTPTYLLTEKHVPNIGRLRAEPAGSSAY